MYFCVVHICWSRATQDSWMCTVQKIKAEIVLWTAGFVLLTLVINAPLLPLFLRVSGLANGEIFISCFKCSVCGTLNTHELGICCSWGCQNEDA